MPLKPVCYCLIEIAVIQAAFKAFFHKDFSHLHTDCGVTFMGHGKKTHGIAHILKTFGTDVRKSASHYAPPQENKAVIQVYVKRDGSPYVDTYIISTTMNIRKWDSKKDGAHSIGSVSLS